MVAQASAQLGERGRADLLEAIQCFCRIIPIPASVHPPPHASHASTTIPSPTELHSKFAKIMTTELPRELSRHVHAVLMYTTIALLHCYFWWASGRNRPANAIQCRRVVPYYAYHVLIIACTVPTTPISTYLPELQLTSHTFSSQQV
jgi:hypothetical protein